VARRTILAPLLIGLLASCGGEETSVPPDSARPVRIFEISGGGIAGERTFPARIGASQRAEVAFRVSGRVQTLAVKEGDTVTQGQLLAKLDPTDFEIVVRDRQARFDNAKRNFDRAKELITGGNISKIDYDRMETEYRRAQTDLDGAKQNLDYTVLTAPFTGTITRRFVQQHEEVVAKQTVFNLQNLELLEVQIDVTEGLIRSLRRPAATDGPPTGPPSVAEFDNLPGIRYPLTLKEVSTEADPQTQTFHVTFTMPAPEEVRVLPGMTATVRVDLSAATDAPNAYWIPARAVVGDAQLSPRVWLYEDGTAVPRPVTVGRMDGDRIEVLEGLEPGDRVIAVGAAFLAEGMKVFPMPESEQAVPRAGDPV
jgi:RND family efflux transporter MFP subunit